MLYLFNLADSAIFVVGVVVEFVELFSFIIVSFLF